MSSGGNRVLPAEEQLARFITDDGWIRADNTVRPTDAFIPAKNPVEVSVTRHVGLTPPQLWSIGVEIARQVARKRRAELHGRADLLVSVVITNGLVVEAAPELANPNHAAIRGWPAKAAQKAIAQQLAKNASFFRYTDNQPAAE